MQIIEGLTILNIIGTNSSDDIDLVGRAAVYGRGGDDRISSIGEGSKLHGGDGDDSISVDGNNIRAWGGKGNDTISAIGTYDSVKLYGEAGDDRLVGGFNDDFLNGGDGNDSLGGFGGTDYLRGGKGDDTLSYLDYRDALPNLARTSTYSGGAGHDILELVVQPITQGYVDVRITGESQGVMGYSDGLGGTIFDKVINFTGMNEFAIFETGSGAAPLIYRGGDSNSIVQGGLEADILIGGEGNETFSGGALDDRFVFAFRPASLAEPGELAMGHDRILDYSEDGELGADTIEFAGGADQIRTVRTENDGITTFTSYDQTGEAIHVLDVVGVGLPSIGFTEIA